MRRSILIVMLDVMVLSVLALTSGLRSGGAGSNIPVPLYRWSTMIEEGLRKEQDFQDQVALLQAQLAEASEIARKAMEQAESARSDAGRERAGNREMQSRLHEAELAAERARSRAALAEQQAVAAEQRTRELEQREAEARARAAEALSKAESAEEAARTAERDVTAAEAARAALEQEVAKVRLAQQNAASKVTVFEGQIQTLETELARREDELLVARTAAAAARERAAMATEERKHLTEKSEQTAEELSRLREQMAALEVQKATAEKTAAQLEEQQRLAEEESRKSVWVRRDESLRRVIVQYTEYNPSSDRSYTTRRELTMPLVRVGTAVLIPADFRTLGLNNSFFSGLSDRVTDVDGVLSSVAQRGPALPIREIIVPGAEPQVCFVQFDGSVKGALQSITMNTLKEQRLNTALLFKPDDVNANGRVEISPMIGQNYLNVRSSSGKKPSVGDYLLSDRGEFIGVMVTRDVCYVTPQALSRTPSPVHIPMVSAKKDETYFTEFIRKLRQARELVKQHLARRAF
jgi:chemotaxis protein histidine kinase CheA